MEGKSKASNSNEDVSEDLLAGIDLEGVTEQEKENIKQALLESTKQDKNARRGKRKQRHTPMKEAGIVSRGVEDRAENSAGFGDNSSEDIEEISAREVNGSRCGSNISEAGSETGTMEKLQSVDDDETQPPSDHNDEAEGEEDWREFDFSKSTLLEPDDASLYNCKTDIDETLDTSQTTKDRDTSNNKGDFSSSQATMDSSQGSQGDGDQGPEAMDDDQGSLGINSPGSQGIKGGECQEMYGQGSQEIIGQGSKGINSQELPGIKSLGSQGKKVQESQGLNGRGSQEMKGLESQGVISQGSQGINGQGSQGLMGKELKGQGSQGFSPKPETSGSAGSQGSGRSEGFHWEKGTQDEIKGPQIYKDGTKEDWPGPQLQRHYRAVRNKSSLGSQYCRAEGQSVEQCAKAIYQLFETYRIKLREAQRKLHPKLSWCDPVKSGQHQARTIDVKRRGYADVCMDLSDEDDFETKEKKPPGKRSATVISQSDSDEEIGSRYAKTRSSVGTRGNDRQERTVSGSSIGVPEDSGSLRRRLRNRTTKVLVEDTQLPDIPERKYNGGSHVGYIVEETQGVEDDLTEYLSVTKDNVSHKQRFENPMHQAKLKEFSIPLRSAVSKASAVNEERNSHVEDRKQNVQHHQGHTTNDFEEIETKSTRGRKRKCKKEPVTLVEDTQDMGAEFALKENGKNGAGRKRKCFRLSEDSDEEYVPETQDFDDVDSPEVMIIEEKSSPVATKQAEKSKPVIPKMFEKVKKAIPRAKAELIEEVDSENESQSPVINKSSRSRNKPVQHVIPDRKATVEERTLIEPREASSLGSINVHSSTSSEVKQAGVKRLFSRPESKESNASDDISLASSQISNTNIDDLGDLYSTQIFGADHKPRHHKRDVNQNVQRTESNSITNKIDDILELDSDEDVLIVKEPKKTFSRSNPKVASTSKGGTRERVEYESGIGQYFTSGRKTKDNDQVKPMSKTKDSKYFVKEGIGKRDIFDIKTDSDSSEDTFTGVSSRINVKAHTAGKDVGTKIRNVGIINATHRITGNQDKMIKRSKKIKPEQDSLLSDEEHPILLDDFRKQEGKGSFASDKIAGGSRAKRQRKTDTVTMVDDEPDVGAGHRGPGAMLDVGGTRRRGRRGRHMEEAEEGEEPTMKAVRKEEPKVQCPMCSVYFHKDLIERHADTCMGPVTADDEMENQPAANMDQDRQPDTHDSDSDVLAGNESPVTVLDTSVQDVLKDIQSSPGEEGEVVQCYVCDGMVMKGESFQQHLSQCMQRARQQQLEVDTKGFRQAFQRPAPDDGEQEVRQTRRRGTRQGRESPVTDRLVRLPLRANNASATVTRAQGEDRYKQEPSLIKASSGPESETDSSSWDDSSGSSSSADDENVTLGSLARAGSSSLVAGPWNSTHTPTGTQADGSNPIPDWLKRSADSPIKSFVPTSMQNSEYFNKQFSYNERRVQERQKKRKRTAGGKPKRKKRRKVRRKKRTI